MDIVINNPQENNQNETQLLVQIFDNLDNECKIKSNVTNSYAGNSYLKNHSILLKMIISHLLILLKNFTSFLNNNISPLFHLIILFVMIVKKYSLVNNPYLLIKKFTLTNVKNLKKKTPLKIPLNNSLTFYVLFR